MCLSISCLPHWHWIARHNLACFRFGPAIYHNMADGLLSTGIGIGESYNPAAAGCAASPPFGPPFASSQVHGIMYHAYYAVVTVPLSLTGCVTGTG